MSERLLVPGDHHPDWGPADVDPSQAPSSAGPAAGPSGPSVSGAAVAVKIKVVKRASRRKPLKVRVSASAPARITVTLCRVAKGKCRATKVRRVVDVKAGDTVVALKVRKLRAGRYSVVVTAPGTATAKRAVRLR